MKDIRENPMYVGKLSGQIARSPYDVYVYKEDKGIEPHFHLIPRYYSESGHNFELSISIYKPIYVVHDNEYFEPITEKEELSVIDIWLLEKSKYYPHMTNWEVIEYFWITQNGFARIKEKKQPDYSKYLLLRNKNYMKYYGEIVFEDIITKVYVSPLDAIEPHFHLISDNKKFDCSICLYDAMYFNHQYKTNKLNNDQKKILIDWLNRIEENNYYNNWQRLIIGWVGYDFENLEQYILSLEIPDYSLMRKFKETKKSINF